MPRRRVRDDEWGASQVNEPTLPLDGPLRVAGTSARPGTMASWQQRAGRGDEGPEGYALGDVTRIGVQTIKDIFKGTADGTREITGGIKRRWQEEQYGITGPLTASGAGASSAGAGPSGGAPLVASAPASAPSTAATLTASRKKPVSLLGEAHVMPGAASGGTAALGCVAKGAGVVWGVGKELVLGAGLGVAKGAVALVDRVPKP